MRTGLLVAAVALMFFGAFGSAFVVAPDVHGDLVEIGVRRSVLGAADMALYASALSRFGFAVIVAAAAVQSMRGFVPARAPLAVAAAVSLAEGVVAFSRARDIHHFGPILMGLLIAFALFVPARERNLEPR